MVFGDPKTPLERVAVAAITDRLGVTPPPMWSLEQEAVGIHPNDPEWAYLIVRVPVTLAEVTERLRALER